MNVLLLKNLILVLLSVLQFTSTSGKKYVHHHHTHVFVVKEKKPQRENHIHYYDKAKNNAVNHHIYIPYIHPPVEDEEEEESVTKYTVTAPNSRRQAANSRYHSARQLPFVYEEPRFPVYSRKYRFYERSFDREHPSDNSIEYYDADTVFPVVRNRRHSFAGRPSEAEYEGKSRMQSPDVSYDEDHTYRVRHLYYPNRRHFSRSYNNRVIN